MLQNVRILAVLSGAMCLACTGSINGSSGAPSGGPDGTPGNTTNGGGGGSHATGGTGGTMVVPPPSNMGALDDAKSVPGQMPLRRLTKVEYDNTIRDLLGVSTSAGDKLTPDQGAHNSGFSMGGAITGSDDARAVFASAEEIATSAIAKLGTLLPCGSVPTARADQDACADKFVESFGLRAFRRPLAASELADLRALYRAHRDASIGDSFEQSMEAVIAAMLQTPNFLYHWEVAPEGSMKDGALLRLGPYELASRLSYLFWASMPDTALFTAAHDGKLNSPDDVAREARRMMGDEKAKAGLQDFFLQMLEIGDLTDLGKDPSLNYSPDLAHSMENETRNFVSSLFFGNGADGKLTTLLTSPNTTVDAGLAKVYGISGVTGTATKQVALDANQRAGIFTQASFLTAKADEVTSHPVKRGDAVLRRVLCTELIIPANLVVPPLPEPKPGQTTRERFDQHAASPCATCHVLIDPVGFAFEHYDAVGAWRATEEGKNVDATGTFTVGTKMLKVDGAVDMMKQLAATPEARDCIATQWLRYTLRRRELDGEAPSLKVLESTLGTSGDLRELMVAATKARTFTHRAATPGEVSP
jgi:hypothetical protein